MITVHHLETSRSQRVLRLLEELGVPYEIRRYQRHPVTRLAPPELRAGNDRFPNLQAYKAGMEARPAYQRAIAKGGPVVMSA